MATHPRLTAWAVARANVIGIGLSFAGLAALFLWIKIAIDSGGYSDFASYGTSVDRWLSTGHVYSATQLRGPFELATGSGGGFAYPPPTILILLPFTKAGYVAFTVLSIGLLASGLLAIVARHRRLTPIWIGLVACLAFLPYSIQAVVLGNVLLPIAGMLAWAYVGGAGPLGALAGLVKITPVAMAALDGWHGVAIAIGIGLAATVLTLPIVGGTNWPEYVTATGNARPFCESSISLACLSGSTSLALASGATLAFAAVFVRSRLVRLTLVTAAIMATSMEIGWISPYFVELYPLVVALAASVTDGHRTSGMTSEQLPRPV
jgi:hypothetical protein